MSKTGLKQTKTKIAACQNKKMKPTIGAIQKSLKLANKPQYNNMSKHPLRNIWKNMLSRCNNPRDKNYKYYGARGIIVFFRWHSLNNFVKDMEKAPRPGKDYTLDRIDYNKGYYHENVRWADKKTQMHNRRNKGVCYDDR
jgi:hypothetical protein